MGGKPRAFKHQLGPALMASAAATLLLGCISVNHVAVPAPPRGANPRPTSVEPPASTIPIRASFDLAPLVALVKSLAPNPLVHRSEVIRVVNRFVLKVDAQLDYTARLVDVDVSLAGDRLTASATVDFKLKLKAKLRGLGGRLSLARGITSCGYNEPMPRIRLVITGVLRTLPGPVLRFERTAWRHIWVRHCKITAFNFRLERILNLPVIGRRVRAAIDNGLASAPTSIDLAARIRSVWRRFNRPHELSTGVWFLPRATRLSMSRVVGKGTVLSTRVFMTGRPTLIFGSRPNFSTPPMPRVAIGAREPNLELAVGAQLRFASAARQLLANLQRRTHGALHVRAVSIYGSKGKLVIGLTMDKPVRGTVYALGTAEYRPMTNTIVVPDLALTRPSKRALASAAPPIIARLRRALVLKTTLAVRTQYGGRLRLRITAVKRTRVWLSSTSIHVSARLGGLVTHSTP